MNNQLLLDAFVYFAKFPLLAGVLKGFTSNINNLSGYDALKAQIEALQTNSIIPGIKDYVFGVDEARIKKRIDNMSDYYLLVDYGEVQAPVSAQNVITQNFYIALTVARPFTGDAMDDICELLITQQCYTYLMQIMETIRTADRDSRIHHLKAAADATPFHAPKLNNSIGWTIILQRSGALQL